MIGISIPQGRAFWTQSIVLDGRTYEIAGDYNQREGRWYIALRTEAGERVWGPRKVVANWDLLRTCTAGARPPGQLLAVDRSGVGKAPGFAELGDRVILVYVPASEVSGG